MYFTHIDSNSIRSRCTTYPWEEERRFSKNIKTPGGKTFTGRFYYSLTVKTNYAPHKIQQQSVVATGLYIYFLHNLQ